jgi:chemotaxis protein methyltransferase CheR
MPIPQETFPVITDADFERFRDFFYKRTGINFTPAKRYFVDRRLQVSIAESGESSFANWFTALRFGIRPDLLQGLVNNLTVNETYFLREDYQFDCLVRSALPDTMSRRSRFGLGNEPVRILSIPCSTGEEPYSIALRLLEEWPQISQVDVSIVAADIDTNVLTAARRGRYGARSLQRVPDQWLTRYFTRHGHGHYRIRDDIREAVEFVTANICDSASMASFLNFDIVFCRNLLIYFDEVSARRAAENLYDALRPGGYLFLGHSESMSRISGIFAPVRFPEGLVYQRPLSGGH